jgi:hypothetical protein
MTKNVGLVLAAVASISALAGCDDSSTGEVDEFTLHVIGADGEPMVGIDVVFHDADGAVLAHVQSGADGTARYEGGVAAATLATSANGRTHLTTVTGLFATSGSATLKVPDLVAQPAPVDRGTLDVAGPGSVANANVYLATNSCSSAFLNPSPAVRTGIATSTECLTDRNTTDVYAVALSASGDKLAYGYATDIVHGGGVTAVDIPAWRIDFLDVSITAMNPPEGAVSFDAKIDMQRDGRGFGITADTGLVPIPASGEYTFPNRFGQGFADQWIVTTSAYLGASASALDGVVMERRLEAQPASQYTVDINALLPALYDLSVDVTTPERPSVSWRAGGPADAADASVVGLGWSSGTWSLLAPPDVAGPVRFPALPAALSGHAPGPAETVAHDVELIDNAIYEGYDALLTRTESDAGERYIRSSLRASRPL